MKIKAPEPNTPEYQKYMNALCHSVQVVLAGHNVGDVTTIMARLIAECIKDAEATVQQRKVFLKTLTDFMEREIKSDLH
jgi:hypothetical protein